MPNVQLDDLVFPKTVAVADLEDIQQENSTPQINIIDIFKAIKITDSMLMLLQKSKHSEL